MRFVELHAIHYEFGTIDRVLFNPRHIASIVDRGEAGCEITTTEAIDVSEGFNATYKVRESFDEVCRRIEEAAS